MTPSVTLVGSRDPKLTDLLRQVGVTVHALTKEELAGWGQPGSRLDTVVIDTRSDGKLPSTVAPFKRRNPDAPVIIVAATLDPTLMLEAMRAGITECLPDPVTQDDLTAALRRVSAKPHAGGSVGKVFAFLGAKGGVGTTTTAVNVATELARLSPASVLLADLHLTHGDSAVYLGAEPRFSVVDAIENVHRLDDSFLRSLVVRTASGVDLLGSSDRVLTMPIDAARVRTLVDVAAHHYKFTILDVPRSDSSALDALEAADRIIVVANQELATVRGASRIAETLRRRYGRERISVVVSRHDPDGEIGQRDVEKAVGIPIRHLLPSDYRRALQALNAGQPLVVGNHCELAASFRSLAAELAGVTEPEAPKGGGLFSGFRRRS